MVNDQQTAYDKWYAGRDAERWKYQEDQRPLTAYLRDRRLNIGVDTALKVADATPADWDAMVVCGGAGGEGTYLANRGFKSVTVTDISTGALEICRWRDPRLKTLQLNAESVSLAGETYDLVLVQDGLHHLPRPVLGFTEMLRVSRRAVVVIEPHTGVVPNLIGTEWEKHGEALNYVFRWNSEFFEQCVYSLLLQSNYRAIGIRTWEHNVVMGKVARLLRSERLGLATVKAIYGILNSLVGFMGNKFVGVVVKDPAPSFARPHRGKMKEFAMPPSPPEQQGVSD